MEEVGEQVEEETAEDISFYIFCCNYNVARYIRYNFR